MDPVAHPSSTHGFEVRPAALIGAAGTFDAEADALAQASAVLQSRLAALGACWGTDEVGQRFGDAYEPVSRVVLGNLAALSGGLIRIAAALRAVANSYEAVDMHMGTPSHGCGPCASARMPTGPESPPPSGHQPVVPPSPAGHQPVIPQSPVGHQPVTPSSGDGRR